MKEIEAKIRVGDLNAVRRRLSGLGAANAGTCLERNWVLDDAADSLRTRGVLLRIRNVGGPGGILTVKMPLEDGEFKTREEVETMVDSTDDLLRQFEAIGYRVMWIYEKVRQTWQWRDCVLALDQCPEIGSFVEIEGAPAAIRSAAADLGLDPGAHIGDNYLGLWMQHLEAAGSPKRHMLFSPEERAAIERSPFKTKPV